VGVRVERPEHSIGLEGHGGKLIDSSEVTLLVGGHHDVEQSIGLFSW
jgi:hypothetical protein